MKPRVKATVGYEIGSGDNQGGGVTVIVTLYNYEAYITNALDSVRNQTFSNLELVIVDDGSQDNSARMGRQWIEKNGIRFNKAKLLCHLENHGVVQARNTAFENATSDFVFVLDADNEIYPTAIAKLQSACIQTNAEAAYSQLELFGEASGLGSANYWSPERFMYGNYVDAMALIKKAAWKAAGGYSDFTIPVGKTTTCGANSWNSDLKEYSCRRYCADTEFTHRPCYVREPTLILGLLNQKCRHAIRGFG